MAQCDETVEEHHYRSCLASGRPYFGSMLGARQGDPQRHLVMQALVKRESRRKGSNPLRILEIGSWAGSSAITWADALERHHAGNGCVVCVDPWRPYFHAEGYSDLSGPEAEVYRHMESALAQGRVFDLFLHNVRSCGHEEMVIPVRGRSEIVLPLFHAGSFDVVFVDGDHTYPHAKEEIRHAQRLVSVNGVLCGDDLELQMGEADEAHARTNAHRDYVRDPRTGRHYHPGVAVAVAECFGHVSVSEGLWSVRRGDDAWLPDAVGSLSTEDFRLPSHLEGSGRPRLVRSGYYGYNVVQYRDQWIAVAELLGPVDLPALSWTEFSHLEAEGLCVTGPSLAGVLAAVAKSPRSLELLQIGYQGFNLVRLGPRYVALAEALGPVDLLTTPAAMLEQWIARGACVVSEGLDELKARVDTWVTGQCPA